MILQQPLNQPESAAHRYEKKFVVHGLRARDAITILKQHPAMFRELYPMRFVNNIYLDSPLLNDFYSNVNGYQLRQKVRVRWYHDLFRYVDDAILEFKLKEGEVGTKEQQDKRFRATVDAGLSYYHLGKLSNRFMHAHHERHFLVVEMKYMVSDDPDAHHIISALPFRITRSSKYVNGVEHIYL